MWYSPADRAIVLWECFREVWRGFGQALIARSPGAKRFITTWEDSYERAGWRRFLERHGYRQAEPAVFTKPTRG